MVLVASLGALAVGVTLVALVLVLILLMRHKSSLIFGKYPEKGLFYHLKYCIALVVLRRLRHKIYHKNQEDVNSLDKPQELSLLGKTYDVVSFMGANEKGEKLVVTLERRRRGVVKACLYLWLPGRGLLSLPKLPDMLHFTTDGATESMEFSGSGLHIRPVECMRHWSIRYKGPLRETGSTQLVPIELDLEFSSTLGHFNYNRDLSPSVIADSVAREPWNGDFYRMLHQVDHVLEKRLHYEQNGRLQGVLRLDGGVHQLKMRGYRDHSFGTERCLSMIHRYVYFALFLDDGTNLIVGNLSQPSFFLSSLKVGYVCTRDGVYEPITACNFELYTYGEKGTPPQNQSFIVNTATAQYLVQIKVAETAVRFNGANWDSKVFDQFVTCTVNGVEGHGLAEYLYRNTSGRPETVSSTDPEWYRMERAADNDSDPLFF